MQQPEKLLSQQTPQKNMLSLQSLNSLPHFLKTSLESIKKYENVRRQGLEQRIIICDLLKVKGNSLLKEHLIQEACQTYAQALSIFRYIMQRNPSAKKTESRTTYEHVEVEGDTQKDMSKIKDLKIALYNKLTVCYMKLGNYKDAIRACDEALFLYPQQPKTLYRRAQSILQQSDLTVEKYNQVLDNLKAAQLYLPNDKSISQLMERTKLELTRLQKSEQPLPLQVQCPSVQNNTKISASSNIVRSDVLITSNKDPKNNINNSKENLIEAKTGVMKLKEPNKSNCENQIENRNEIWQMLHPNEPMGNTNFDYALSYEIDPKKKAPPEVEELGRFLNTKCKNMLALYKKSGMTEQAKILRENFAKALASKERIERISRLDFTRPTPQLKKVAENFGVELNDPSIMEELKKVQEENLRDIKHWLNRMSQESAGTLTKKSRECEENKKDPKRENNSSTVFASETKTTITNNYYINNNYYNHSPEKNKDRIANVQISSQQRQFSDSNQQHEEIFDLLQNISNLNKAEKDARFARMMNFVLGFLTIFLLLLTMYFDINSLFTNPREGPRDL